MLRFFRKHCIWAFSFYTGCVIGGLNVLGIYALFFSNAPQIQASHSEWRYECEIVDCDTIDGRYDFVIVGQKPAYEHRWQQIIADGPSSDTLVGFGKYAELSYKAARADTAYTAWIIRTYPDSGYEPMREFGRWLEVHRLRQVGQIYPCWVERARFTGEPVGASLLQDLDEEFAAVMAKYFALAAVLWPFILVLLTGFFGD